MRIQQCFVSMSKIDWHLKAFSCTKKNIVWMETQSQREQQTQATYLMKLFIVTSEVLYLNAVNLASSKRQVCCSFFFKKIIGRENCTCEIKVKCLTVTRAGRRSNKDNK